MMRTSQPARWLALACALLIALPPAPAFAQNRSRERAAARTAADAAEAAPAPVPASNAQAAARTRPGSATVVTPSASDAGDSVMLNFVNADIDAVVRAIGQYTGRTFVIDPRVKGTISLSTERPVTRQQAFEQLLSALRLQGFTIVQTGNVMRVVPEADAKLQGGAVVTPRSPLPGGDQLVTQVFRLQYESATAMVPILRPLIAPNNTISAYPQNNTLVITDYAENLRRIARIIESIDTPATSDLEMIPVKFGLAMEIASVVNRVLDEGARAAGQATDAGQRVSILAEPRTNTLIVRAPSQARLTLAKNLIAQLDRPASTPGNINVVYLRNAEAVRLAPLLRAIIGSDPSYVPQAAASGLSQGGSGGMGSTGSSGGSPGLSTGTSMGTSTGTLGGGAGAAASTGGGGALAGMIQADAATNSLIITAPEPLYRNIRSIIDKLDVRRAQVVIESLIVEMTADKAAEFGIQWQALGNVNDSGTNVIAGTNYGGSGTNIIGAAANIASLGQGLNLGVVRGTINIPGVGEILNLAFLARALQTTGDANILSTPTIQTLDNEEAKFLVGQNIPLITGAYTTASSGGTAGVNPFQTFERRDIGLQLRVKPQVSEGGVVRLAIYQELSSIQNTLTAAQGGIITNKRSFESTVLVEDGSIVVLGGLIEDKTQNSRSSVPVLGSIPLIGQLFSYENRSRNKTNLLVFLRPYVVRNEATSSALALDRYSYIRGQIGAAAIPDNFVFRGMQGAQLPESPPTPPAMRRDQAGVPQPNTAAPSPDPTAPGLGSRERDRPANAPLPDGPPVDQRPPPILMPGPSSAAPAPAPSATATPPPTRVADAPPAASSAASTLTASAPSTATSSPASAPSTMASGPPSAAPTGSFSASSSTPMNPRGSLVQVAAVSEIARGRDLQRQLRAAGFDAYWESVQTGKGEIVRVRVAVDTATQSMADTLAKLKSMGFDPIVVTP